MHGFIGVIDYKAGNAPSVLNALNKLKIPSKPVTSPQRLEDASAVILPGVGAARATMDSLAEMGMLEVLDKLVNTDKIPYLGICVGMQVLFDRSEEGETDCLGWLSGRVVKFNPALRVPQMGWNQVVFKGNDPIAGIPSGYFYFVNSYYAVPESSDDILGTTDYGGEFCSAVRRGNIWGTQFHLEKSGSEGLRLLKNFAALSGVCPC